MTIYVSDTKTAKKPYEAPAILETSTPKTSKVLTSILLHGLHQSISHMQEEQKKAAEQMKRSIEGKPL